MSFYYLTTIRTFLFIYFIFVMKSCETNAFIKFRIQNEILNRKKKCLKKENFFLPLLLTFVKNENKSCDVKKSAKKTNVLFLCWHKIVFFLVDVFCECMWCGTLFIVSLWISSVEHMQTSLNHASFMSSLILSTEQQKSNKSTENKHNNSLHTMNFTKSLNSWFFFLLRFVWMIYHFFSGSQLFSFLFWNIYFL